MQKTKTILRRCFEVWYRSRISVIVASGFMTAASSRILIGYVDRQAVLLVALCTASAYWVDDCLDFRRDRQQIGNGLSLILHRLKYLYLFCALMAVVSILPHLPTTSVALLFLLTIFTLAFCVASLRLGESIRSSRRWIAFRTVSISFIWSLATVLLPIFNQRAPVTVRVGAAVLFTWTLMLVVSAMWTEGEHPERQTEKWPAYERFLTTSCWIAGFLVALGIAIGWFPWMNLALLPACASNLLFLAFRFRFQQTNRRVLTELLILMNLLDCLFVLGAYDHPDCGSWPQTWQAYGQLGAFLVFFGNIVIKSFKLKGSDDRGDYLDLLFLLGLGVFGFQILVSVFQVEGWLFSPIHHRVFASSSASVVGAVLIACAVVLQSAAYLRMADSWRLMAKSDRPARLVTTGPFALSRNPIYVSAELYFLGEFLVNGTAVFAFFVLFAPMLIHVQIRREEDYLSASCPMEFKDYVRLTPRYLFSSVFCVMRSSTKITMGKR